MKQFFAVFIFLFAVQCSLCAQDTTKLAGKSATGTGSDSTVHTFVEVMPIFPGGDTALTGYLQRNIKYPLREKKKNIDGTVYVYFEITKDGSIRNVRLVKGVPKGPGLGQEAVRVISEMPNWIPGTVNGEPVNVSMTMPIKFVLTD